MSTPIPTNMDYHTLVRLIQDNMQKNDELFNNNIPGFIARTEAKLGLYIRNLGVIQWVNATGLSSKVPKPSNWRTTQSVRVSNGDSSSYPFSKEYEYCRMYDDEIKYAGNVPEYYADNNFDFWYFTNFVNASTASVEIGYFGLPVPLTAVNPTNWWTTYCPQALFYGSMLEASLFTRDDGRAQAFMALAQGELEHVNAEDKFRLNDGAYSRKTATGE